MTLAELARLRAEDGASSGSSSSSSAGGRQQAQAAAGAQQAAGEEAAQQQDTVQQEPLPPRFTDAELVRFAIMQGLLQAASPAEREARLREGASAAARTALWLERHLFSSDAELGRFAHLVRWEVRPAARAGRAVRAVCVLALCRRCCCIVMCYCILTWDDTRRQGAAEQDPRRSADA